MHIGKEIFCKTVRRLGLVEREGRCLWSDFMQKYAKIPWLPTPLITSSFKIKMVGSPCFWVLWQRACYRALGVA